jgi:hypothetical protein
MMTKTFMAGCKYTSAEAAYSNVDVRQSDSPPMTMQQSGCHSDTGRQAGPVFVSTVVVLVTAVPLVGTTGTAVGVAGTGTTCRE